MLALLAACWPAALAAQAMPLEVALCDGRILLATAIEGDPAKGLELVVAGERRRVAGGELLAVHGVAAAEAALPTAWLEGGDVVRGALVGGDSAGDRLDLLSPVLGRVALQVDRLAAFAAPGVAQPTLLRLPEGVGEALFRRATVGYDLVAGTVHQFGEQGLRFQPTGDGAPRWFPTTEFVALRIADAAAAVAVLPVALVTRAGDRLGVRVKRFTAAGVQCELEGGAVVDVRLGDLACLTFRAAGVFLSDLAPREAVESGFDGEAVHPWRRDAAALGGPLLAAGRTHGKGLGVHSRSRLTFVVPAGAERFWTRVALDDSAGALVVRANADVRVLHNGKLVFEQQGLEPGQPPRDTGLVPVRAGDSITLEADFGRGRDLGDRIDWLSPVFLPTAGRRP